MGETKVNRQRLSREHLMKARGEHISSSTMRKEDTVEALGNKPSTLTSVIMLFDAKKPKLFRFRGLENHCPQLRSTSQPHSKLLSAEVPGHPP